MSGITVNDRSVRDEELPPEVKRMKDDFAKSETYCGEPHLRDNQEMTGLLNRRFKNCRIETLDGSVTTVASLAHCDPVEIEGTAIQPSIRLDGTIGADHVLIDLQAIMRMPEKTGNSQIMVVSARRTMNRLGDC